MSSCCQDQRKAHHEPDFKKRLTNRLKRIEGQVRGVQKMIDDDVYCDDVLTQISAIRSALGAVSKELFEAHLNSCIVEQIHSGSPSIIDELKITIAKLSK
ncbi:MAG: metal-sensitive transcriptional regulator [Candidatus Cloacimonetes bacterium]|jgi:DNA-binding FrmR family transcriptional regulator|nr:metal-sensitive transcriptional regulator [Candidatus Cloacimonadota bacterium]MDD4100593.1 metal-sensitive transcriptional regulator [Candidatus Cloacimonadota bacterium]